MKRRLVREIVVVVPLLALSLFLGLYPKPVLDRIEPSVERAVCTTSNARATTASPKRVAKGSEARGDIAGTSDKEGASK